MPKNRLVLVGDLGDLGDRSAFLNVSVEDAVKRWTKKRAEQFGCDEEYILQPYTQVLEFDDEFMVYDAWEK